MPAARGSPALAGTTLQRRVGAPAEAARTRGCLQGRRPRGFGEVSTTPQRRVCAPAKAAHTRGCLQKAAPTWSNGQPCKAGLRLSAQAEPCAHAGPAQAVPQCVRPRTATFAECGLDWPEGQLACAVQHGRRAVTVSRSEDLRDASLPPLSPPLRLTSRRRTQPGRLHQATSHEARARAEDASPGFRGRAPEATTGKGGRRGSPPRGSKGFLLTRDALPANPTEKKEASPLLQPTLPTASRGTEQGEGKAGRGEEKKEGREEVRGKGGWRRTHT